MARGYQKSKRKQSNQGFHKRNQKPNKGSKFKVDHKNRKRNYDEANLTNYEHISKRQNLTLVQSSSDESENEQVFNKFVSTFTANGKAKISIQSSSESEEDEEDIEDEENDNVAVEDDGSESNLTEHGDEVTPEDLNDSKQINDNNLSDDEGEKETSIVEKELDEELADEDSSIDTANDPFVQHLHFELEENFLECVQDKSKHEQTHLTWPQLGKLTLSMPKKETSQQKKILDDKIYAQPGQPPNMIKIDSNFKLDNICIKPQIIGNVESANEVNLGESDKIFTDLQKELFSIVNNYQDLYYPERTFQNAEEIRFMYCLHTINHILKTRTKILHHNAKLSNKTEVPDDYRDQGLVRPKVLIVVPFRDSALKIVQNFIKILVPEDKGQVINKLRFMDDFSGGELAMPKKNPKPEDYQKLFCGNTDDTFRIGLSITKKTLKLYTEFYSSDIIIASPLGLRVIVGAAGDPERDFDFLASMEVLILDQTEQFLMQNWDHFLHVMDHLHMQPKDSHGTDFSRVRMWSVNGWAKYYRQTLIFSSYSLPEINAFFNKKCLNYAGKIKTANPVTKGSICKVFVQIPHVFNKFNANSVQDSIDARFEFFKKHILSQYKDTLMKHTLIYIPSYFDFVRVRNYFKQEEFSFVQICEYSKEGKVARARDRFFHAESHFLLYSERFHHFRRIRLKGIRHIIFYQPPTIPNFYAELCNFMMDGNQNQKSSSLSDMSVTVMYCKYDMIYLNSIIGTDRSARMLNSDKSTHMFMTGE